MNFLYTVDHQLVIESQTITVRGIQPVFNHSLIDTPPQIITDDGHEIVLEYRAPILLGATFSIRIEREHQSRAWLRYRLKGLPESVVLGSFGVHFTRVENLRAYLRNGYFSWDGSEYVEAAQGPTPGIKRPAQDTGYAMTQLLPFGTGSMVIGFDRHDRFQQTLTFGLAPSLTVETLWDRKARPGASDCESERLVIFEHPEVEEALREWARLVAAASPISPRRTTPIVGWCSWYNLYAYITEEIILDHLHGIEQVAQQEQLAMQVFQIDDGFTPEMGDWLEFKPQFPRGMKPLLDDIRAGGLTPGLWIGPFMVGNRSHLYRDHPDWVVRDAVSGGPLVQMKFYGEYRWHKRSEEYYILDATHPDALAYLRRVFRVWRQEWGCEYFKTDFMHFGSAHGPDRAVWHTPGLTRIEIWRRVAEMIRQEIGAALWLGCGCPLWASVGLVDGVRISHDVGVTWQGERAAEALLRDQPTRNFANGILWLADPDCILLRDRFHELTDLEVRSLAIYAGMSAGVLMTSDALDELSPGRLDLWKLLINLRRECCFPLLGQTDPMIVAVQPGQETHAIFILNSGDIAHVRRFTLASLGLPQPLYLYDWNNQRAGEHPVDDISVNLGPHDSILLFAGAAPLKARPTLTGWIDS